MNNHQVYTDMSYCDRYVDVTVPTFTVAGRCSQTAHFKYREEEMLEMQLNPHARALRTVSKSDDVRGPRRTPLYS